MTSVRKVLRSGKMPSSLEYIKRFSMCNCLTIPFPDTYTAHAMTIDFFLRRAAPGWKVGVYKVPKRIDTFMFSPFNEAFHDAGEIDGVRYTRAGEDMAHIRKKPLVRLTPDKFAVEIDKLRDRVTAVWGDALKILVLYDSGGAEPEVRRRLARYDDAAIEALDWPVVRVRDNRADAGRLWHHYPDAVRAKVLDEVEAMEEICESL